jgi:hypothetical protein
MRSRVPAWPLLALLLLAGCATSEGLTPADLKARWDAQNLAPRDYKGDLIAFLRTYLNDPTGVRGAAVAPPVLKTVGYGERYVACVRYNARDSDGKYRGMKEGAAVYVSGKLDRFVDTPRESKDICREAAYAPFPELEKLTR